jgi:hypothetical protein
MFEAATHLVQGRSLETLLTLKAEKSQICSVGTRRLRVSVVEQQSVLFLKTLIRNEASMVCRLGKKKLFKIQIIQH